MNWMVLGGLLLAVGVLLALALVARVAQALVLVAIVVFLLGLGARWVARRRRTA